MHVCDVTTPLITPRRVRGQWNKHGSIMRRVKSAQQCDYTEMLFDDAFPFFACCYRPSAPHRALHRRQKKKESYGPNRNKQPRASSRYAGAWRGVAVGVEGNRFKAPRLEGHDIARLGSAPLGSAQWHHNGTRQSRRLSLPPSFHYRYGTRRDSHSDSACQICGLLLDPR